LYARKLLQVQVPKAQKNTVNLSVFFALLGYAGAKDAGQMLV